MTACYASLENARGFQLLTLLDLPNLFPNAAVATVVSEKLYSKYFKAEFARNEVRIARMKATGPSLLFLRKPLARAGLSGRRVFGAEGVQTAALRALHALPVAMETPLIHGALDSGKLDGAAVAEATAEVYGIDHQAPFLILADIGRTNFEYCLNPRFHDRLPEDLKPVLNAWLRAEGQAEAQIFYGLNGAKARERYIASGASVRNLSAEEEQHWKSLLSTIESDTVARLEKTGLPARQLMIDARRLIENYGKRSENDIMQEVIEHPIEGMLD
jgi:TRAP-type C4-dicarboxylate transport system substrate-binding protein